MCNHFVYYTVIDDIIDQQKIEEKQFKDKPHLIKSYEKLEHDFVLWHFVNDLRPSYVESADEAGAFITTVDFRFINFDNIKRKKNRLKIPICIHPTNLIQILQLWIPRDENFDIAVLSNLRFPFLFTEFDADTELTTIRIIEQLSRYENINDLKEDTVTSILFNQALRQKIQANDNKTKDITLVKDAIIEEIKVHKILVEDKSKQVEQLGEIVKENETLVNNLTNEKTQSEQTKLELIERLNKLENEKRLESKYYTDKENWLIKKEHELLKKWDELPKRKWYLPGFAFGVILVIMIIILLYYFFSNVRYFSILISLAYFIFATIGLSFFNREKIVISFLYNVRPERFRKNKMKEFENEFLNRNPHPQRNNYTEFK